MARFTFLRDPITTGTWSWSWKRQPRSATARPKTKSKCHDTSVFCLHTSLVHDQIVECWIESWKKSIKMVQTSGWGFRILFPLQVIETYYANCLEIVIYQAPCRSCSMYKMHRLLEIKYWFFEYTFNIRYCCETWFSYLIVFENNFKTEKIIFDLRAWILKIYSYPCSLQVDCQAWCVNKESTEN